MNNIIKNSNQYFVYPLAPSIINRDSLVSDEQNEFIIKFLYAIILIALGIIDYFVVIKRLMNDEAEISWFIYLVLILIPFFITNKIMSIIIEYNVAKRFNEIELKNLNDSKLEAVRKTESVRNIIIRGVEDLEKIKEIAREISASIKKTEREYYNNSYSSYWDNIENTISLFDAFKNKTIKFSSYYSYYDKSLEGRNHSFPKFPITEKMFPSVNNLIFEYVRVRQLGERNFEFASIYESRKTREAMIGSFKNLDEAIKNIENQVRKEISSLKQIIINYFRSTQG